MCSKDKRIEQLEAENADLRGKLERAYDDGLRKASEIAQHHKRNHYRAASDIKSDIDATLTEQANIRSPVQSEMAKMVDPR